VSGNQQPVRGIVRQGDVLLVPVEGLPARRLERVVEHSTSAPSWRGVGHTHLVVEEPASLVHDEHDAIGLEPGVYHVRRQREYVPPAPARPQGFRRVAD
jgi:hypothetical protein